MIGDEEQEALDDLRRRVAEQERAWREEAAKIDDRAGWMAPDAWRDDDWLCLLMHARERDRYWRNLLLDVYGVDFAEKRPVRPASIDDLDGYPVAAAWALFWSVVIRMMVDAYNDPPQEGQTRGQNVCAAYLAVWRARRALPGFMMELCPDPRWREFGAVALAAAVAAGAKGQFPEVWRELLPGATVEAWGDLPPLERTPTAVKAEAVKRLRGEKAADKKVRQSDGSYKAVPPTSLSEIADLRASDDVETFVLLDEAERAVREVLTPRQAEIWELDRAGYSYQEIADLCDIRIGTVGAHLSQIRDKVEEVR